jgi:hypothetical protein
MRSVAAGQERRLVGEQEADERCDFFGPTEAAQRMARDELLPDLLGEAGEQGSQRFKTRRATCTSFRCSA